MLSVSKRRTSAIALTAFSLVLVSAPAVLAGGSVKPSDAPPISLGQMYFGGSLLPSQPVAPNGELWRLPSLLPQDVVTVAGQSNNGTYNIEVCLAGNIDDYSFNDSWCNNSERAYLTPQGRRVALVAAQNTPQSYLEFHPINSPYQFTVESVQHAVGLGLTSVSSVKRKGVVRGTAHLTNGAPVPDGFDVALVIRKGSKKWVRVARTTAGQLTFGLKLPKSAKGKVKLSLSRGADGQYLAASTQSTKTRIT